MDISAKTEEEEGLLMKYTADNLTTLSPGKAYRSKLGMYLSADLQEAIDLGLRELVYNAQDEYEATKQPGAYVRVKIDTKTQVISVSDNMRGIPVGKRTEDGINSLTAAFLIPHSGAKHESGVYSEAVGINGQGAKIVTHTAEWLKVVVKRDGKIYQQSFHETEEGAVPDGEIQEKENTDAHATGTEITYKPSSLIYKDAKINVETLSETLKTLSYFTKGLEIILDVDGKITKFHSVNGLADGLNAKDRFHPNILYYYDELEDCKVELALQWNKKPSDVQSYANNLYVRDGGAFMTGFKTSLTRAFNSLSGGEFTGDQIRRYLNGFVSVKVKTVQFSNQAKTALANPEARTATSAAITEALRRFSLKHKEDFDLIVTLMEKEVKAERAAERARQKVLDATKEVEKNQKRKTFSSDKLKDAENLGENSMLLLVEGNSSASTITTARDYRTYGVLALRGKMINMLTNSIDKIYENEEVKLLLSAMNIIPGRYDSKKLRYGRLGIAVDGDAEQSA